MNNENETNANASGETPADRPRPDRPSEAEYLEREAATARAAIERTLQELVAKANPRALIARYPWWSVGIAAVAGYVFGRQLRRSEPSPPPATVAEPPAEPVPAAPTYSPAPRSFSFLAQLAAPLGGILAEAALGIARQAIQQAFTTQPQTATTQPDSTGQTSGEDPAGPADIQGATK